DLWRLSGGALRFAAGHCWWNRGGWAHLLLPAARVDDQGLGRRIDRRFPIAAHADIPDRHLHAGDELFGGGDLPPCSGIGDGGWFWLDPRHLGGHVTSR